MADRLIKLDEAIEQINICYGSLYWNTDKAHYAAGVELAIDALKSLDTIDPHTHGYWDENNECSECNYWSRDFFNITPKYCPDCGAAMDLDKPTE